MSVKRWALDGSDLAAGVEPDGEWVRYRDHAAEVERLTAERNAARATLGLGRDGVKRVIMALEVAAEASRHAALAFFPQRADGHHEDAEEYDRIRAALERRAT